MALFYSTNGVHPRDRVAYWREEVIGNLARHQFRSSVGPAYNGKVSIDSLAHLGVAAFDCDPCELERTRKDLAHGASDDFVAFLQLSGKSVMAQDGRHAVLESGTLILLDASRTCTASHKMHTRCVNVVIPRRALEARLGSAAALTARTFDSRNPVAGLAAGYLAMLPDRIGALDGPNSSKIAEQVLDLLALALSAESEQRLLGLSSPRGLALLRLKSAIEARLCDPELKPAAAAAAAGISVRYANALLSQEGTSIERYILQRRLERCRDALEDPAQAHRTIGEIAYGWGFWNVSHFGRRFKDEFGLSPTGYRHHHAPLMSRKPVAAPVAASV